MSEGIANSEISVPDWMISIQNDPSKVLVVITDPTKASCSLNLVHKMSAY